MTSCCPIDSFVCTSASTAVRSSSSELSGETSSTQQLGTMNTSAEPTCDDNCYDNYADCRRQRSKLPPATSGADSQQPSSRPQDLAELELRDLGRFSPFSPGEQTYLISGSCSATSSSAVAEAAAAAAEAIAAAEAVSPQGRRHNDEMLVV